MNNQDKIETLAASLAANGIKSGADFSRACRPSGAFCWTCAGLGLLAVVAVSVPMIAAGLIPARWLFSALLVCAPVAVGAAFGLRAFVDSL